MNTRNLSEKVLAFVAAVWTLLYVLFAVFDLKVDLYWEPSMLILIVVSIVLALSRYVSGQKPQLSNEEYPDPRITKFFLGTSGASSLWFVLRMYVGAQWLLAGWEKAFAPANVWWNGVSIHGFALGALAKATGAHPAVQGWYAWFLQHVVLPGAGVWGVAITLGEIAVGLGILLGILTGIAAFFGVLMNFNYLLAGTVSINPILGVLGLFLILSWKVCGYIGFDYVLPAWLGIPSPKRVQKSVPPNAPDVSGS